MLLVSHREYLLFFHLFAFFCAPPGTHVVGFIWTGNWNAQTSEKLVWNCLLSPDKQDICLEVVFPRALLQIANLFFSTQSYTTTRHKCLQLLNLFWNYDWWVCMCIWKTSAGSGALDPRILSIGHGVLDHEQQKLNKHSRSEVVCQFL